MLLGLSYDHSVHVLTASGLVEPMAFIAWGTSFESVMPALEVGGWQRAGQDAEVWLVDVWGGIDETGRSQRHAVIAFPGGDVFDPSTPERLHISGYRHIGDAWGLRRK